MGLPNYHVINLKSSQLEDIRKILGKDMNLRHPVAIILKSLDPNQQRETIGIIENYFVTNNISFKYPYPVYLVTELDASVTNMPTCKIQESLPAFFTQKDSKMNVKEMHLVSKNKLIQQELINCDAMNIESSIHQYGTLHRQIYKLETEKNHYIELLKKLKGQSRG